MHNTSVPEFISIRSDSSSESKRGGYRGSSSRGQYGPPKTPRGIVSSRPPSGKRKREATSPGDHRNDVNGEEHFEAMPWHPSSSAWRYTNGILGLHEEIEDFYQWMVPTSHEHHARLSVVDRVRKAILKIYPCCRVEIFGSFRTGLYLPTSDIDLVICGKWPQLPFGDLSDALQHIAQPGSLKVLERAAVPIIKLADDLTGIKVDISFNMANGLRAAELIKHFKKRYPALPKLIYVLKQFLYQRDLNEVYSGGLSSYALILMVVSFLQQHVREDARSSKANLGVLLVEFFELYGVHFNYTRTAIRITDDGAYLKKEEAPCYQGGGFGTLCIEDPYDINNDVGKSSYGFPTVKKTFEQAYFHLLKFVLPGSNVPHNNLSILSQIIRVSDDILTFRQRIAKYNDQENTFEQPPSEDPLLPPTGLRVPSKDVLPKELPGRFFCVASSPPVGDIVVVEASSANNVANNAKSEINANLKDESCSSKNNVSSAKKESDNLSGVSMGTSSMSSSSTTSSLNASSSDTDAIIANGQATPNSAMSISPANSEVCSILDNNKNNQRFVNNVSSSSGKSSTSSSSMRKSKTKTASQRLQRASNNVERSDLDLEWRSNGQRPVLSADEDPNWRDHRPLPNEWRTIKSKNRKIQGNSSSFEEKGNNEELDNDGKKVDGISILEHNNDNNVNNGTIKKKKSKKKKNKKNNVENKLLSSSENKSSNKEVTESESNMTNNENHHHHRRVSRFPGQIRPKR